MVDTQEVSKIPSSVQERLSMRSDAHFEILSHWQRYFAAAEVCRGRRVVDVASGEGYGSNLLAQVADRVTGVDIDQCAVEAARAKYRRDNLRFEQGSLRALPADDGDVDVVVSFETIEHVVEAEQNRFLSEVRRVLRPDGLFIVSTPDKYRTDRMGEKNPYHLREYYLEEFWTVLRKSFSHVQLYFQDINVGSFLWRVEPVEGEGAITCRRIDHREEEAVPTTDMLKEHLYMVAVCSNAPLEALDLSGVCHEISRRAIESLWHQIGQATYQAGLLEREVQALKSRNESLEAERQQVQLALQSIRELKRECERAVLAKESAMREREEAQREREELHRSLDETLGHLHAARVQVERFAGLRGLLWHSARDAKRALERTPARPLIHGMIRALGI